MRVREGEVGGVESLPMEESGGAAIEVVSQEGMPDVREVDADLMRPARRQAKAKEGVGISMRQCRILRDGALSVGAHLPFDDAAVLPADGGVDYAPALYVSFA